MSEVTLSQYLEGGDVWGWLRGFGPLPVPSTDLYSNKRLNRILITKFGNRLVSSQFLSENPQEVIGDIYLLKQDEWEDLASLNSADYSLGGNKTVTVDNTKTDDSNTRNTDNTSNVAAYDSDVLVPESGNSLKDSENRKGETNRVITKSENNLATAFKSLTLKQRARIITVITHDIADYLTLNTY